MGSCEIFRKMCLCVSAPGANRTRATHSHTLSKETLRCSLLCCGPEGVPADEIASWLTLQVILEFRLLSPVWSCAGGGGQGPDSASSPWEFWANVAFAEIPCPVACACLWKQHCGLQPFSSSSYLWCHIHEMVRTARPSAPTASALSTVFLPQVLPIRCVGLFMVPTLLEDCEHQSRPGNPLCLENSHCGPKSSFSEQALIKCSAAGTDHPLLPWQGWISPPNFWWSTPLPHIYDKFFCNFTVSLYSQLL